MSDWLAQRWAVLKAVIDRRWFRFTVIVLSAIGTYDTLGDQVLPKWLAEKLPPVRDVVDMTTGWLPWWAWVMLLMVVLTSGAIEYAVRVTQKSRPTGRGPLQLTFEPRDPWVQRVPNARTPPASNPNPTLHPSQWVKTDSLWFRVQPKNNRSTRVVRGVRVFLTNAEILRSGAFADIGFGTQRQIRWANDDATPFEPRDIHHLEKHYVDVLSVDDVHNKVFIKWPALPQWLAYGKLFDTPGVYRLSLIATSSDADGAGTQLNLLWSGQWNQAEMWVDDLPIAMAKAKEQLWQLFHDGVDMRNAGQEKMKSPDAIAWDNQFFAWRGKVLGFADCLSTDLKHHLQTMNKIDPSNVTDDIYVNIASEMLARVNTFLTRELSG